jgi:hypothetical protein
MIILGMDAGGSYGFAYGLLVVDADFVVSCKGTCQIQLQSWSMRRPLTCPSPSSSIRSVVLLGAQRFPINPLSELRLLALDEITDNGLCTGEPSIELSEGDWATCLDSLAARRRAWSRAAILARFCHGERD